MLFLEELFRHLTKLADVELGQLDHLNVNHFEHVPLVSVVMEEVIVSLGLFIGCFVAED